MFSGLRTGLYFIIGLLVLILGMVSEFIVASLLPPAFFQFADSNGIFLVFFIVFFSAGVYIMRRSVLGIWRCSYDSIIYFIAALLCAAIAIETLLNLQIGHPYLELASTNFILMILLWAFILPPINPVSSILIMIIMLGVALANWIVTPNQKESFNKAPETDEELDSIHWLQSIGQLTRINVWLGSIFLLTIAFILLGGPPLSQHPLPLYDSITWLHFAAAVFSASFLNSFIFIQNQLGDLDTDRLHTQKSKLPMASGHISRRTGTILAILFLIFAIGLSLYVSLAFFSVLIVIVLLGFLYSGPPLRLKSKPIVDLTVIGLAFGTMAVIAAWIILGTLPELPILLLIGSGVYYAGTHGLHTASDYDADNEAGLRTTAVFLGRQKAIQLGLLLIALGLASLYIVAGYYTHLFWYGILKFKTIFLYTFCGFPLFAILETYRKSDKTVTGNKLSIDQFSQHGRNAAYCLFLIMLIYCLLYVYLFYPTYYP